MNVFFLGTRNRIWRLPTRRFQIRGYTMMDDKEALIAKYTQYGSPNSVIHLEKQSLPPVGDGQVLVRMLMAPINPSDLNVIEGTYPVHPLLPAVGGNEGVGKVVTIGKSVNGLKVNDYVIPARSGLGTWRSHMVVDESNLMQVDSRVSTDMLACLAINPCTALRLLDDFVSLKEGDVLIQNGANSAVGSMVLQLAALRGIKTINIIREGPNQADVIEKLKTYGAYIVDTDKYLNTPEFRRLISDLPKPKLALNCTGGPVVAEMARLLDYGATMVTYGAMSRKPITLPSSLFIFKDLRLRGFWLNQWLEEHTIEDRKAMYTHLTDLFLDRKLRIWTERHTFSHGFDKALERSQMQRRERKVLLEF